MDVYQAVMQRRSVRSYKPEPVPEEILLRILDAGRLAPSAWNAQPWRFVVVRDEAMRLLVARNSPSRTKEQMFIAEAPVIVVAVATVTDRVMGNGVTSWPIDMAIAIDHMMLAAAGEGLGTCWIGSFKPEMIKEILGIPEEMQIAALFPLGYPADEPKRKSRKELGEIICWESFTP